MNPRFVIFLAGMATATMIFLALALIIPLMV